MTELSEKRRARLDGYRRWPAPAKLNLFLHITGRRDDGYHTLQTLFQFVDWGDELIYEPVAGGEVLQGEEIGIAANTDLTVRAARLLQSHTGCKKGVRIHLYKSLPMGGGLGGGSSDAATTLLALNQLWELGMDRSTLLELGLRLGADVPVFIFGHAAWADGIGEQLHALEPAENWYVLGLPPVSVSTAAVFADPELTRHTPVRTIRDFQADRLFADYHNDLEPVVRKHYPEVDSALNWLSKFGPARMTGSGATVFLPVPDRAAGEAIVRQAPGSLPCRVVRGCNRHPLYQMPGE